MDYPTWCAGQRILENRVLIEQNGLALLEALGLLLTFKFEIPAWISDELLRRLSSFQSFQSLSLDQAFDIARITDRTRIDKAAWTATMRSLDRYLVRAILDDPMRPIDTGLFEEIGEKLGINKNRCEEIYRDELKRGGMMPLPHLKEQTQQLNAMRKMYPENFAPLQPD